DGRLPRLCTRGRASATADEPIRYAGDAPTPQPAAAGSPAGAPASPHTPLAPTPSTGGARPRRFTGLAPRHPIPGTATRPTAAAEDARGAASSRAMDLHLSDRPVGLHLRLRLDLGPERDERCDRRGGALYVSLHARLRLDLVRVAVGVWPVPLRD